MLYSTALFRLQTLELEPDYGVICQHEADAALEIRGMPSGNEATGLDAMYTAGLLHTTAIITVACLIDVPPPPSEESGGPSSSDYVASVERSVALTSEALLKSATEPTGTPEEVMRSRLLSSSLTDVAFGVSAHTDGRLRMVVALVSRPVLAVSLERGGAQVGAVVLLQEIP